MKIGPIPKYIRHTIKKSKKAPYLFNWTGLVKRNLNKYWKIIIKSYRKNLLKYITPMRTWYTYHNKYEKYVQMINDRNNWQLNVIVLRISSKSSLLIPFIPPPLLLSVISLTFYIILRILRINSCIQSTKDLELQYRAGINDTLIEHEKITGNHVWFSKYYCK